MVGNTDPVVFCYKQTAPQVEIKQWLVDEWEIKIQLICWCLWL